MLRVLGPYALILAAAAFLLEWLEYRHAMRTFGTDAYIALIALLFAGLGLWAGARLFEQRQTTGPFRRNDRAVMALGLSSRELEVLDLIAQGQANKEIARTLGISPNTVKTHVAHVFEKLDAPRRTHAIARARELRILP
ncbi:response regulator transcription factor [Blastomonas sp.]|uniref:response regulator transcription factor n=1 Tax=Blastomonas sp. TaxID=1909299 RepID=UPI0035946A3B